MRRRVNRHKKRKRRKLKIYIFINEIFFFSLRLFPKLAFLFHVEGKFGGGGGGWSGGCGKKEKKGMGKMGKGRKETNNKNKTYYVGTWHLLTNCVLEKMLYVALAPALAPAPAAVVVVVCTPFFFFFYPFVNFYYFEAC